MGASLSALEIYQRLHLWERVISCYQAAGRLSQAERIIRERMEVDGESVLLWCLLGDTTQVSNNNNRYCLGRNCVGSRLLSESMDTVK